MLLLAVQWNLGNPGAAVAGDAAKQIEDSTVASGTRWWSFQPVKKAEPPAVKNRAWSDHPVDRFILSKLEERGLKPAAPAEKRTLLRRVTFALAGLPPTPDELEAFVQDTAPDAYLKVVDRLLASPHFGERWARHWMDLVRFTETHGSEGDPEIPHAWRYRDYLIRAFNTDVPCDQIIREHIAGDLLPQPRRAEAEGINESILGIAHLRFVEHGFQPVDTLDEQAKVIENQIDVLGKAFQGLTLACARCHDHKFDPVSQRDFYALYGIFASCVPSQVTIDLPERLRVHRQELMTLKREIKDQLAEAWTAAAVTFSRRLLSSLPAGAISQPRAPDDEARKRFDAALADTAGDENHPLHPWAKVSDKAGDEFAQRWQALVQRRRDEVAARRQFNSDKFKPVWNLEGRDAVTWFKHGINPPETAARSGEFCIEPDGERIVGGLLPAGVYSHLLSQKHNGLLTSPRFRIESDSISVRALGGKGARVRLIVDNYPIGNGNIFPQTTLKSDEAGWIRLDTAYRKGASAYLEFAPAEEVIARDRPQSDSAGRSYFGAQRVVFHDGKEVPKEDSAPGWLVLDGASPRSAEEIASRYVALLADAVAAWRGDKLQEAQRVFLDFFVRKGLLPNSTNELKTLAPLVARYRRLESDIPVPRRSPGVLETAAYDAPFLPRGDYTKPGQPVARRYLQILGGARYQSRLSGRLELANEIASGQNPLTARVMVNRIWHHLFGRGLVRTVDNFGRLGEQPTHAELLDCLAARFVERGWSFKEMIRLLVTSRTYQMSSEASARARESDPENQWLSHMGVRRLDAEAIRDSLLAVSERLDGTMFGPGVDALAPPAAQKRRSIYLTIRRNNLSPFLEVFDAPKPFTTLGRRDATNVPAQSLALLNDPFVIELAKHWAGRVIRNGGDIDARVRRMFDCALARPPTDTELAATRAYLAELVLDLNASDNLPASEEAWRDFAQSLFNLKEFIYLR